MSAPALRRRLAATLALLAACAQDPLSAPRDASAPDAEPPALDEPGPASGPPPSDGAESADADPEEESTDHDASTDAASLRDEDARTDAPTTPQDVNADAGATLGQGDAGPPVPPCVDALQLPLLREAPPTLADTALYLTGDAHPGDFAPYARPFQPQFELWSDGATKQRFVYLPSCSKVDTSDMDNWRFPVGARFWKEFRKDGTLLETRFIHRYGPGANDWLFATYAWDLGAPTPERALRVVDGAANVNGTQHDIPSERDCRFCHVNLPEPPLAFSAIQLSHALPGETLLGLAQAGRLTKAPRTNFRPPGDETARAALGYLHANCGHCHNSHIRTLGNSFPNDPAPRMRLSVKDSTIEETTTYRTLVWVATFNPAYEAYNRIEPCNPHLSSVLLRMGVRSFEQMPPLATEKVHEAGVALVSKFLKTLHAPGVDACPVVPGAAP